MNTVTVKNIPVIDPARCRKCNDCIRACPRNAIREPLNVCCSKCVKYCITMEVPCSPEHAAIDNGLCDGCGLCISSCPHGAIGWSAPGPER